MTTKVIASTSGMVSATTRPARTPRLTKLTASTMATASKSARVKLTDRLLNHHRLVRDEVHADADRQVADDAVHLVVQRLAEFEQVGTGLHPDGQTDGRLAAVSGRAPSAGRCSRG